MKSRLSSRSSRKTTGYFNTVFSCFTMLTLAACTSPESSETLSRVTAPDSLVDALLVRVGGHATVPFSYEVYIVPRGASIPDHDFSLFGAIKVDSLELFWEAPRLLGIRYAKARIYRFRNEWAGARDVPLPWYTIEVRLHPTSDRSLPEFLFNEVPSPAPVQRESVSG